MIKTISYLGLGTMGSGMASNLLKTGYQLTVWNRSVENVSCSPGRALASPILQRTPSVKSILSYCLSNDQAACWK